MSEVKTDATAALKERAAGEESDLPAAAAGDAGSKGGEACDGAAAAGAGGEANRSGAKAANFNSKVPSIKVTDNSTPGAADETASYGFGGIESLLDIEMGTVGVTSPLKTDTGAPAGGSAAATPTSASGGTTKRGGGGGGGGGAAGGKGGGGGGKGASDSGKGKGARTDSVSSADDHLLKDPLENMPEVPGATGLSKHTYGTGPAADRARALEKQSQIESKLAKAEARFRRQQLSTELWKLRRRGGFGGVSGSGAGAASNYYQHQHGQQHQQQQQQQQQQHRGAAVIPTAGSSSSGPAGGARVLAAANGGAGSATIPGIAAEASFDADISVSVPLASADLRANLINRKRPRSERRSSRQLERHVRHIARGIDPNATESSSGASSEEEDILRGHPASTATKKLRRLQARWDGDRSEIGWRWSWLQLRLDVLQEQIEEHDALLEQVKGRNTPFEFEGDPQSASVRAALAAQAEGGIEVAAAAELAAAAVGAGEVGGGGGEATDASPPDVAMAAVKTEEEGAGEGPAPSAAAAGAAAGAGAEAMGGGAAAATAAGAGGVSKKPAAAAAAAAIPPVILEDAGCARARGLTSARKRRRLIKTSTMRPKAQAPLNKSATPLGHSDRNAIRARAALLDRNFHLVLSLLTDAPSAVLGKARAHRRLQLEQLHGMGRFAPEAIAKMQAQQMAAVQAQARARAEADLAAQAGSSAKSAKSKAGAKGKSASGKASEKSSKALKMVIKMPAKPSSSKPAKL
eukprot:gene5652-12033_t